MIELELLSIRISLVKVSLKIGKKKWMNEWMNSDNKSASRNDKLDLEV